jgi:hypothetical protein
MAADVERRQAERYRINANVTVRHGHGERIAGVVVDISSSGVAVRLDRPYPFQVGDTLTVEVEFSGHADKPIPHWGVARVVRLDGDRIAMQLAAASFGDPAPKPDEERIESV